MARPTWLRKYPALLALVLALLITVVVLPSALNVPQANPTTVLEYAPIPPEDDNPPPPSEGALSSLGLGTSSSLTTAAKKADVRPGPSRGGRGSKPVTKRCVGKPPRQTEDRNAPPCVPFFEGDNGGVTWQGVTADEITVLLYYSTFLRENGESSPNAGTYCDVDKPPDTEPNCSGEATGEANIDISDVLAARALSRFFNERFQTYNRHVHFYVYWSSASSPAGRRSDAADNWARLKPFAVIDQAFFGGYTQAYAEAMAKRGIMVFGTFTALPNSYYRGLAPYVWSFWPDVEHGADQYVSYICQKIAPYKVRNAGDSKQIDKMNGKPRRYALMSTTDKNFQGLTYFAEIVKAGLQKCPNKLDIAEEVSYSRNQWNTDTHPDAAQQARTNIAKMRAAGVTTVLWLGGYETQHSLAAFDAKWFPEWVVAGDSMNDGIGNARDQQQEVWRHAWLTSNYLAEDKPAAAPGRQAFREAEPTGTQLQEDIANEFYALFFTLFKAIQVAGPHLQPGTVDQGQHAIARQASVSPYVAACWYDPGDYTCVKDAQEIWWDPDASDPEGDPQQRGCYRMVRAGKRYLAGGWEGTDADVFSNRADPCNTVDPGGFINPYGPAG